MKPRWAIHFPVPPRVTLPKPPSFAGPPSRLSSSSRRRRVLRLTGSPAHSGPAPPSKKAALRGDHPAADADWRLLSKEARESALRARDLRRRDVHCYALRCRSCSVSRALLSGTGSVRHAPADERPRTATRMSEDNGNQMINERVQMCNRSLRPMF